MATSMIQAHRGYTELYPENTMLAFREAVNAGANGLETDVLKTADGHLIIMHDLTVDRTTNGTGAVSDLTLDYLKSLDAGSWFGAEFANRSDCKVLTLDEFLLEFKDKPLFLILHFNGITNTTDLETIVNKVVSYDMLYQVQFSGRLESINHIKSYNPRCFTQNDGRPSSVNYQTYLQNAITYGHEVVSVHVGSGYSNLQTMVTNIHNAGKLVHVSFLESNYEVQMQNLIDLNVDYVLGNNPQIMSSVFDYNGLVRTFPTKNIGVWSIHTDRYMKIDGVWRLITDSFVKENGQWRRFTGNSIKI